MEASLQWHMEAVAKLAAQNNQMNRTLWMAIWQSPDHKLTLDEGAVPPLWKLEKTRNPEGKLVLEAQVMEFPSPEKIDALVNRLTNTTLEIGPLQKELGLEEYAPNWLGVFIGDRLVRMNDGLWVPSAIGKAAVKQSDQN